MQHKKINLTLLFIGAMFIIALITNRQTPVSAGTPAFISDLPVPKLCDKVYLPMITNQSNGGNKVAPLGIILPPPEPQGQVECQTFSDFNGDGYDDLLIGVPSENVGAISDGGAVNVITGTQNRLNANGSQYWNRQTPGIVEASVSNDRWGQVLATGDFNGDGYIDAAIGSPRDNVDGQNDAGSVQILYGSANGITTSSNQVFSQSGFINGAVEASDFFASALAVGDFNGDGYDDLAAGVPGEDIDNLALNNVGAVNIIFGSSNGLTETGDILLLEDDLGIFGTSQDGDSLGTALAAADFDKDGYDDLAIGIPNQDLGQGGGLIPDAGIVFIVAGSANGPNTNDLQIWNQAGAIQGTEEDNDRFGSRLTTGDFNGDSYPDLVVGSPFEDVGAVTDAGAVNIIFGSSNGLTTTDNQFIAPSNSDFGAILSPGDSFRFAWDITAGDYDGDGYADLAVGIPHQDVGILPVNDQAGAAFIIFGGQSGLDTTQFQFLSQINSSIQGTVEPFDLFGWAVSTGDYNGDGYADLAVGSPQDDDGALPSNAGSVTVFYGVEGGVSLEHEQVWTQDSTDIPNLAETGDSFGYALP